MYRTLWFFVSLSVSLFLMFPVKVSAISYNVTFFQFPGLDNTGPTGINNDREIVGNDFLRFGNNFTTIDFPGGSFTALKGINEQGDIVGNYQKPLGNTMAFLFSGGVFSTINTQGLFQPTDINNHGDIVGDINGRPVIVSGGIVKQIVAPNGFVPSDVSGINDAGDMVGDKEFDFNHIFGILLTGGKAYTIRLSDEIILPGGAVSPVVLPADINNNGQYVGFYIATGGIFRPFLGIGDMGYLFPFQGSAQAINDDGDIVGGGVSGVVGNSSFLATPVDSCLGSSQFCVDLTSIPVTLTEIVPEPATWLLLGSGLVALAFARRKLSF